MTISLRYCELKWLSYTQVSKSSGFSDNMVYSIPLFFIEVVYFIRLSRGVKNKKNVYFCVLVVVRSFHDSTEIFVERCLYYYYIYKLLETKNKVERCLVEFLQQREQPTAQQKIIQLLLCTVLSNL